jgi:hypothetical protein
LSIFQQVEKDTLSGPEEDKNLCNIYAIFMQVAYSELNLVPFQPVSDKTKSIIFTIQYFG